MINGLLWQKKRAQWTKMKWLDLHIDTEQAVFNHSHLLTPLSYLAIIMSSQMQRRPFSVFIFLYVILFISLVKIIVSMYFMDLIHAKKCRLFCWKLLFTLKHLLIHTLCFYMFSLFSPFVLLLSLPLSQCLLSFCNVACETVSVLMV